MEKIIIADINGIIFDYCPRCNKGWTKGESSIGFDFVFSCTTKNCIHVHRYYSVASKCLLSLQINDSAYLEWHKDHVALWYCKCDKFVDYYGEFTCSKCRNTANIILPILPYDISIEDINVCMHFI
jgi:hypothetical protein